MKTKDFIITLFFIITLLVIYGFFPTKNPFQQLLTLVIFLIIIPLIFNKFFLKRKLSDLGVNLGDYKQGLILSVISFIVIGCILFLVIKYTNILKYYLIPIEFTQNFWSFIFYELFLTSIIVFAYELFFRGFIMFSLTTRVNYYVATLIQAIVFLVFAWGTGGFLWLLIPYLLFSPLAGFITYKSSSIVYSGFTQFIILVIFDASVISMINK